MPENFGQFGATPRTPALHRSLGDTEHLRGLGHRITLDVDEDDRYPLVFGELAEGVLHHQLRLPFGHGVTGGSWFAGPGFRERHGRPGLPAAHPVEAGVHHDAM
jgi:hypothetical protein